MQGQMDPPLSELGRSEARCLADRLAGGRWAALYSSDLIRAMDTATAVAERAGVTPIPTPELREINLGDWEGLAVADLATRYPKEWEAWRTQPSWDLVPGGEGEAAFVARSVSVTRRLMEAHPGEDILAVTHGGVIQVVLAHMVGASAHGFFPFRISNTSLTVLEKRTRGIVVASVNDTCHLSGC
jgi:broad specificity phosphatase PhoE